MSRRPARCTQADLNRAVKAAGPGMAVEVLPDGTIRITPLIPAEKPQLAPKVRVPLS